MLVHDSRFFWLYVCVSVTRVRKARGDSGAVGRAEGCRSPILQFLQAPSTLCGETDVSVASFEPVPSRRAKES